MDELETINYQIILYSKSHFDKYLSENNYRIANNNIIKRMISHYCGLDMQYITDANVYFWVSNTYQKLFKMNKFPNFNVYNLMKSFMEAFDSWKLNLYNINSLNYIIDQLLGFIAHTEIKYYNELGIDIGEEDINFITNIYGEDKEVVWPYICTQDEEGNYRLIKYDGKQYSEVIDKLYAPNKERAMIRFREKYKLGWYDIYQKNA